jgi:hypothetical protein
MHPPAFGANIVMKSVSRLFSLPLTNPRVITVVLVQECKNSQVINYENQKPVKALVQNGSITTA